MENVKHSVLPEDESHQEETEEQFNTQSMLQSRNSRTQQPMEIGQPWMEE